jgi:hypothetical protein
MEIVLNGSLNVQFQVSKQKTRLNPPFFKSQNRKHAYSPIFSRPEGQKTTPPPLEAKGAKSLPPSEGRWDKKTAPPLPRGERGKKPPPPVLDNALSYLKTLHIQIIAISRLILHRTIYLVIYLAIYLTIHSAIYLTIQLAIQLAIYRTIYLTKR